VVPLSRPLNLAAPNKSLANLLRHTAPGVAPPRSGLPRPASVDSHPRSLPFPENKKPSPRLVLDGRFLLGRRGSGQEQGAAGFRLHHYPPFSAPERCVFDQREAEYLHEKRDGLVVVAHYEGCQSESTHNVRN
jgi:hypothetical protein